MSANPVHTVPPPWFYPVGNTPPVCLTQNLPPDLDASLLLLGCGDIRNILFTTYSELKTTGNKRVLDFTCCDITSEIIARNIIALSIIIDDVKGERVQQLWNIYYHVFLDTTSAKLLRSQAQKLLRAAGSLQQWADGPYAELLRFCDGTTLNVVAKLWTFYACEPGDGTAYNDAQATLRKQLSDAKRYQEARISDGGWPLDGLRSMAPLVSQGFKVISGLYREFWKSGTCLQDQKAITKLTIANPMFFCHRISLALHYGANPLAGYHLAPAYAELAAESPLRVPSPGTAVQKWPSKAMQSAITQLSHWGVAFRAAAPRITVRFVTSDALAFCYVLKHQQTHGESKTACSFRSTWTYEPLVLDAADYGRDGSAPTAFDVIDTSNLVDHLGCLNLLAGTSSLLKQTSSSIIRTETLIPREGSWAQSAGSILCGDLPTIALLLGLKPVQYWANATATWHAAEHGFPNLSTLSRDDMASVLSRPIMLWRPIDTSLLHYDATELGKLLLALYLKMFEDESWTERFRLLELGSKEQLMRKLAECGLYTRASFVVLLQKVKEANVAHWDATMSSLVQDGIFNDETLNMGPHHLQSLLVHLETMQVWEPQKHLDWWNPRSSQAHVKSRFGAWENVPAIVCVTLVVPYAAVAMFKDVHDASGTPLCQLQLHSSVSPEDAFYPDIQLGFGSISVTGKPYTDEYALSIHEDGKNWQARSPLIVSAMVSTRALVEFGKQKCNVAFALTSTPSSSANFVAKLGIGMLIHRSALGKRDVFVTRYPPNMKGHINASSAANSLQLPRTSFLKNSSSPPDVSPREVIVSPVIHPVTNKITSLRIRFTIASGEGRALLQNAGTVAWERPDPYQLVLTIDKKFTKAVSLPLPLSATSSKIKIARKSLWVEYTAPVAEVRELSLRADSVFPVLLDKGMPPTLENLHYIYPDVLPRLNCGQSSSKLDWLGAVTSPMTTMAEEEYKLYDAMLAAKDAAIPGRLGIKETVQSIYAHIFGLSGHAKGNVFWFTHGISSFAVVFVDSVRMDISNQSVILDAALVPRYSGSEMQSVRDKVNAHAGTSIQIQMQDAEIEFWKHLLPTFAERCRQWQHKACCEYAANALVPLCTDDNKDYMCSCGFGMFPVGYLKTYKNPKLLLQQAVRVAIPVLSASPINKDENEPSAATCLSGGQNKENAPPVAHVQDMAAKKNSCFGCSEAESKNGQPSLQRCSKCRVAQYCSAECQKKDWKMHKQVCKQLQEHSVYDG